MSTPGKINYSRILYLMIGVSIGVMISYTVIYILDWKQKLDSGFVVPRAYIVDRLFGNSIIHVGFDGGTARPIHYIQSFCTGLEVDSLYKDPIDQHILGFGYTKNSDFGIAQIYYSADEVIACAFYNQIDTRINKCFRPTHLLRIFNIDSLTYGYDHYNDTLVIRSVLKQNQDD